MNKPVTYRRKKTKRKLRACKKGIASDAVGQIEKGMEVYVWTFGQFSLIDVILAIVEQTGPVNVDLGTWVAAEYDVSRIYEKIETAQIKNWRMLVDYSFENRQPEFCEGIRKRFGPDSMRSIRNHSKFVLLYNDDWSFMIRTSMNLNSNIRLENLEISEDPEFCLYWKSVVDDIWAETADSQRMSQMPQLTKKPDYTPYQSVACKVLTSLNQIKITHELKNE